MNLSSLLPWKWTKFDPARTRSARRQFDVVGGYDAWHAYCQSMCSRQPGMRPDDLSVSGMEIVTIMTPNEATKTKQHLLEKSQAFMQKKKDIDYADTLTFENLNIYLPILEKMFTPEIDSRILNFFGSEYMVQGVVANRSKPTKESKRSFLWHCDRGPQNFLKLNLFLDSTSEHGGTTEFLNLAESRAFENAGYTFGANERRVSDLGSISRKIGTKVSVIHPQLDAGQAFMFLPSRALHRGFLPTTGIRHVLLFIIMPSPVHWRKAWDHASQNKSLIRTDGSFAPHAEELFDVSGVPSQPFRSAA